MESLSTPVYAEFSARNFITGCGVAIFHVKSERVVLCYHTKDKYWFLPKGRRDAGEETRRAAEREGFEEVCISSTSPFLPLK
jgi:8-oxo-dGTP pyrophosphatase MutT (NUDIX family)